MQVIRAIGATIRPVKVVVAIAVEGAAEALRVAVVNAGHSDRQAHPPVVNIGPNKGPGGKDQLQEESHTQHVVNIISSCSKSKSLESERAAHSRSSIYDGYD